MIRFLRGLFTPVVLLGLIVAGVFVWQDNALGAAIAAFLAGTLVSSRIVAELGDALRTMIDANESLRDTCAKWAALHEAREEESAEMRKLARIIRERPQG